MAGIAIITGIFVSLLSGTLINHLIQDPGAAFFAGAALGICAAYPIFKLACQQRANFLHPARREYNVPVKIAFAKIRDFLAEISYNYGDKWHVVTADTQTGRIIANLRFTDEHTNMEFDARGNVHARKERLQRFLILDIHLRATAYGTTIVQLDFSPKVEGMNYTACDSTVLSVLTAVSHMLGPEP
jgi:hypothetical protein